MSAAALTTIEVANQRLRRLAGFTDSPSLLRPVSLFAADFMGLGVSSVLVSRFVEAYGAYRFGLGDFTPLVAIAFALFCAIGLYAVPAASPVAEIRKLICAMSLASLTVVCLGAASSDPLVVTVRVACLVLATVLIAVLRPLVRSIMIRTGHWLTPTVVIGSGVHADRLLAILDKHKYLGFRPVAILDDLGPASNSYGSKILREHVSQAQTVAQRYGIRHAIVADPDTETNGLREIASQFTGCFREVLFIRDYAAIGSLTANATDIGGLLGLQVSQKLLDRWHYLSKRLLDAGVAGIVAALAFPVIVAVYLAIRFSSKGPVMYGQSRVGQDGHYFTAWKFRTMVTNADEVLREHLAADPELRLEWELTQKLKNDPRVLPIGRFLRKTSLDELPQLWNVICGDMSLVGPRPIVKGEVARYGDYFDLYKMVRPGITGMWQISGRSNTSYEERISFDEYYVKNWSVWLDLYILFRTIKTVLLLEGAC